MRFRETGSRVASVLTVLGSCLILHGCPNPCCPEIESFAPDFEFVCLECPDSGPNLFFEIRYKPLDGEKDQGCDPADIGLMRIKNLTADTALDPTGLFVADPDAVGFYTNSEGGVPITITETSEIELRVTGDKACDPAVEVIRVEVVGENTSKRLCMSYNEELMQWSGTFNSFGPGVVIRAIESDAETNLVPINIDFQGTEHAGLQPGDRTEAFSGFSPNGFWRIRVTDDEDRELQAREEQVCVIVYLTCDC